MLLLLLKLMKFINNKPGKYISEYEKLLHNDCICSIL